MRRRVPRRQFLKGTSLAAAGALLSLPARVAPAAPGGGYDTIIVGAGTAGSMVAARLVRRFAGHRVLLLEAGGPTSAQVGGRAFPPYDRGATIFDVPGEYPNIPFQPKGEPFRQKETPFTFQGAGYGGNSQFNGMLYQAAPPFDFDSAWPAGWRSSALRPYFEALRRRMAVTDTPSADLVHYNDGATRIAHDIYRAHGFVEVNTSELGGLGERYFGRPYVVSDRGLRGGPVRSHLTAIVGADGRPLTANLTLLGGVKAERIVFGGPQNARAVGVEHAPSGGGPATFAPLADGGRIVLAGGALMTPRLLLLSGVGPFARHDEIFAEGFSVPFHIDNPGIGVGLFDHVATSVTYEYSGSAPPYAAYHYDDYDANAADLARYAQTRTGPYAQYGPVSVMHTYLDVGLPPVDRRRGRPQPNVEVFVNPFGAGPTGGPYNGPRHLSVYTMLLRPRATDLLRIDRDGFVKYPSIYLTDPRDLDQMAAGVQQVLFMFRDNPDLALAFGPGGQSHPHLRPERFNDMREYVGGWDPVEGVFYARLIINHWGGTCPLRAAGPGGVDPATLRVKGTDNVHVVDASLHPAPLSAHPVATIMAVAERAADVLSAP